MLQNVGTKYGQDVRKELQKNTVVNINAPIHSPKVLARHANRETLVRTGQTNIQVSCQAQTSMIRAESVADPTDVEILMKIKIWDNNITKGYFKLANDIPNEMSNSEKTAYGNNWSTY